MVLAEAFWVRNRHERADEHRAHAMALLGDGQPTRSRAWVLSRVAMRAFLSGEVQRASKVAQQAYEVADQTGAMEILAESLSMWATTRMHLGDASGLEDIERSVELASASGALGPLTRALNNLSAVHQELGDLETGYRIRIQAAETAAQLGSEPMVRWGQGVLVDHRYRHGDWDEAQRDADDFLARVKGGSPHVIAWQVFAIRAELRLAKDDVAGAIADAERALELGRSVGELQALGFTLAGCAHVFALADERARAAALAHDLIDRLRSGLRMQFAVINLPAFASAALRLGLSVELMDALAGYPDSRWLEAVRTYLTSDFAAAAELLALAGDRPDEAEARSRAGDAVNLGRALDFWRSMGATRYVHETESQLAALT
jgi:hypothetical protein